MEILDILQKIVWVVMLVYTNRNKILELVNNHKIVRYMIMPFIFPIGVAIVVIVLYQLHKHPEFMMWADKQKKMSDYF